MTATFNTAVAPPGYTSVPDAVKVLGNPKQVFGLELRENGTSTPRPSASTRGSPTGRR